MSSIHGDKEIHNLKEGDSVFADIEREGKARFEWGTRQHRIVGNFQIIKKFDEYFESCFNGTGDWAGQIIKIYPDEIKRVL